mgnify:CR=1 FL=1
MSIIIEIRAAEGGSDAKLLVQEQFVIYVKFATRRGLDLAVLEDRPGFLTAEMSGKESILKRFAANEVGGMRWQRVPPTEKRGRRQTSTVTVAVLAVPKESECHLSEQEVDFKFTRGSGAGGQHRNTTDSAVVATHRTTGISVRVESERSQHQNKRQAMDFLRARLAEAQAEKQRGATNTRRKSQVGSGMRGDKVRTASTFRDEVVDHRTGKRVKYQKDYSRGNIEALWA